MTVVKWTERFKEILKEQLPIYAWGMSEVGVVRVRLQPKLIRSDTKEMIFYIAKEDVKYMAGIYKGDGEISLFSPKGGLLILCKLIKSTDDEIHISFPIYEEISERRDGDRIDPVGHHILIEGKEELRLLDLSSGGFSFLLTNEITTFQKGDDLQLFISNGEKTLKKVARVVNIKPSATGHKMTRVSCAFSEPLFDGFIKST